MKIYDLDELEALFQTKPFTVDELAYSPTAVYEAGEQTGFTFFPYAKQYAYEKRLNEVVGMSNWKFSLSVIPRTVQTVSKGQGSAWTNPDVDARVYPLMIGRLEIRNPITGEWIYRDNVGIPSTKALFPDKNQREDTFKRCASSWGLGKAFQNFAAGFDKKRVTYVQFAVNSETGAPITDQSTYVIDSVSYKDGEISDITIRNTITNKVVYSYAEKLGTASAPSKPQPKKKGGRKKKSENKSGANAVTVNIELKKPDAAAMETKETTDAQPVIQEEASPSPVTEKSVDNTDKSADVVIETPTDNDFFALPSPEEKGQTGMSLDEAYAVKSDVGGPSVKGRELKKLTPAQMVAVFEDTRQPEVKQAIAVIEKNEKEVHRRLVNNGYNL